MKAEILLLIILKSDPILLSFAKFMQQFQNTRLLELHVSVCFVERGL